MIARVAKGPVLTALLAIWLGTSAQPPTIETVRIDVIVTDRHGQPIEGLRPADFEVRDRGVLRPPEAVDFLTSARVRPAAESPIFTDADERRGASEPGTRVFAFFVDEFHLSPNSAARAAAIVDAFIDDKVHPHDLAAVIRPADAIATLRFTRDRAQLHGVLASVSGRQENFAPRTPMEFRVLSRDAATARAQRRNLVSAKLRELAVRIGQMHAHRAVLVLVSEGFPGDAPDLEHLVRASSLYHFPIYTFNPATADEQLAPADDREGAAAMLQRLAEQTGGLFMSVDSAIAGFARVAHDTEAYYSLTYHPDSSDDTLHRIDVRVKREASVRARTVYWPNAAGEMRALAALPPPSLAVPQRPLRRSRLIDIWVGVRPTADGVGRMAITWEPRTGLSRSARSVLVNAHDLNGRTLFQGSIGSVGGADDIARFAVPAGRVELDLVIRDDTDQVLDTDARDVDVPDWRSSAKAGPQLLPIEIVRTRSPLDARRADADTAPSASRTFMRTNGMLIRTPTFDPSGVPVRVRARLLNLAGGVLYDIPPQPDASEGRVPQFLLPLAGLAPSMYQLELIASNANGTSTNRIEFRLID